MKKVCMIVQDKLVKGGIASVISGYYGSRLEKDYKMIYVESYKDGGKVEKLVKGILGYLHFAKVLLIDKPDLVHIHSSFGPSFYRKIPFIYMASWFNKPVINHIHGADFDEFYLNASKKKKCLIHKVYSKCAKIIALSDEWKEHLSKIVPDNKIVVIENYSTLVNDALYDRLERNCNNTILFLGELGKRKGCYDIPAVVKSVKKIIPDVQFILCGAGSDEDEKAIKELIKRQDVVENCKFPGWVRGDKKDNILRQADIFFLPSYNEGMPMSILDAMGYGLPIVSTNVGGIPKIVEKGYNGYCETPGDVAAFAAGIIELLTDDYIYKKYAKNSFALVKEKYSFSKHIELIERLYTSLFQ